MASIAEIRQQYPQYNDLSDEQLAQGMHRKFYSDMPFDQFAQKIGFSAQSAPAPMPQEQGWGEAAKNVASAAIRPLAKGLGALPLMAMDAGVAARNLVGNVSRGEMPKLADFNPFASSGGSPMEYELPSAQFNRSLDEYTRKPSGLGQAAELVSSTLVGSRVPAPQAAQQAPAGFTTGARPTVAEQTLKASQEAGYVVPPATARPTLGNRMMEGAAGKTSVAQAAAAKNQEVTNNLARRALQLPEDAPLNLDTLNSIRAQAGKVYKAVGDSGEITPDGQFIDELASLGESAKAIAKDFPDADVGSTEKIGKLVDSLLQDKFNAKSALEYLKELRAQASANLSFQNSGDPAKKALGMAQREAAGTLEDLIGRHLASTGKPDLAAAFDGARRTIAKTYTVQSALNESTGNIAATALGSQLKKGKPLSGELETAAKFARAFPKAAKEVTESFPGISPWDFGWGGIGSVVAGNPLPAAYPFARMGLRAYMLSPGGQKAALTPGLGQGIPPELVMGGVAASGQ
jgi:hypothetical protein